MELSSQTTLRSPTMGGMLVIMAKAPTPGTVKTRLAASLPQPAVAALYRCLLHDTIALALSLSHVNSAIMCPASDVDDLEFVAGDAMPVVAQKGEGLAAGLDSAFGHFTAAGYKRVIAFNSDSPHLPACVLERAFEALSAHDLVVGPTHDGGYYLVGARNTYPGLFNCDGLGTTNALAALLARARALQLSVRSMDLFYDIDVEQDLMRLAAELRLDPTRAPRTAAWLKDWGQAVADLRPRIGEL
jgi:uncharacterized protein